MGGHAAGPEQPGALGLTPPGGRLSQYAVDAMQAMAQARDLKGLHAGAREAGTLVAGKTLARTTAADGLARVRRRPRQPISG